MSQQQDRRPEQTEARIIAQLAVELGARPEQARAAIALLDEGATVPFIARYRKEVTGGLDDTQLRLLAERLVYLRELEDRRAAVLASIAEQGKLTPELEAAIKAADTKQTLEDLYLPYKPKRRTRAQIARENGLEPLARKLFADPSLDPQAEAAAFVTEAVADAKAALDGARDILSEEFAENADVLARLREKLRTEGVVRSTVVEAKRAEDATAADKFRDYFDYSETWRTVPSHRALAIFRGRQAGILGIALTLDDEAEALVAAKQPHPCESIVAAVVGVKRPATPRPGDVWLASVVRWSWRVKLQPGLETELLGELREKADAEAIRVFGQNLKDLLLAAPAGMRATLGLDPGLRTGVKVAVVDATGKLLATDTIYPHEPRRDWDRSLLSLGAIAKRFNVELIAIGNGTASRETVKLADELISKMPELRMTRVVVSEAGASVYSASEVAAKEFPELDVSLRGAVSIARRLQDPLAELVKIEPKAIGVGQYQHDVNQRQLGEKLDAVVEDCVNAVGVDVNTASAPLLAYVSGLDQGIARNIVAHREQHGPFRTREALKAVARLGDKAFEQAAGFLRINGGDEPLDASAVHPEAYPVVQRILERIRKGIRDVMGQGSSLSGVRPDQFVDERFGLPTVKDIFAELEKPGRDPRGSFKVAEFREGVEDLKDLQPGMVLEGTVTNVAAFGAFVDIGVHQDGLVHISAMSSKFIKDPREVVKAGDIVRVKVMEVDIPRKRIGLSMRLDDEVGASGKAAGGGREERGSRGGRDSGNGGRRDGGGGGYRGGRDDATAGGGAMAAAFAKLKR
ncbi:Tex family protein [Derxia gummosa]|uniref:Tex family protein n=1 Tax=Derxia gummosa DSM 723 TaxID=1121388 RepID=A0A8B6X8J5_9BURK|nr:Tex family protein [Derxia gummosa]